MQRILILALVSFLALAGCEKKEDKIPEAPSEKKAPSPVPVMETVPFLQESLSPVRVETASEALAVWRPFRKAGPTLIMLSSAPFTSPIPEELQDETAKTISDAADREFRQAIAHLSPDPLLLPSMTLRAALENRFFSRAIWVLPVKNPDENFSWDRVRKQLAEQNFPNASSFTESGTGLSGTVDDTAIDIVRLGTLPPLSDPTLLHIDMSYFAPLYQGEIKTPLYPLLYRTLAALRDANWPIINVTVCPGNADGRLPLETRFLAGNLETIIEEPSLLDEQPPTSWQKRAQALYLENFMQSEKIYSIYKGLEETHPADASIKFALYKALRVRKQGTEALAKLDEAVALDPLYGLEYLNLAPVALEKNTPEAAIDMLQKAVEAFPDNPFIKLNLAQTYVSLGQEDHALPLLQEIKQLDWSPVYYPDLHRMATGEN